MKINRGNRLALAHFGRIQRRKFTLGEVAKLAGISYMAVFQDVNKKHLIVKKVGGRYVVRRMQLKTYLQRRQLIMKLYT